MKLHAQYISDEEGHKTGVILPIREYEKLLEDISDLAAVAERKKEPTVSHKAFLSELKADGII